MARVPSPRAPLASAGRLLGWSVGMPLATVRFLLRDTPLEHRTVVRQDLSEPDDGAVRRRYRARVERPRLPAERVLAIIAADPNVVLPVEVMRFTGGRAAGPLRPGDERLIRMAGPWNGPVRVVAVEPEGIRWAARRGGAQRGEFEIRLRDDGPDLEAEVQLVQRSASRLYGLAYDRIGIARLIERHTWSHVLERVAQLAGGRPPRRILVETAVSRPRRPGGRRAGARRRWARRRGRT